MTWLRWLVALRPVGGAGLQARVEWRAIRNRLQPLGWGGCCNRLPQRLKPALFDLADMYDYSVALVVVNRMFHHRIIHSTRCSEGSFISDGLQFLLELPASPAHYQQLLVLDSMTMTKRTQHYVLIGRMTQDEASTRNPFVRTSIQSLADKHRSERGHVRM